MNEQAIKADANGMVEVVAAIDGVRDNGHRYKRGSVFHMHQDLIPAARKAGQIRLAKAESQKQAKPARDKQFTNATNK